MLTTEQKAAIDSIEQGDVAEACAYLVASRDFGQVEGAAFEACARLAPSLAEVPSGHVPAPLLAQVSSAVATVKAAAETLHSMIP